MGFDSIISGGGRTLDLKTRVTPPYASPQPLETLIHFWSKK